MGAREGARRAGCSGKQRHVTREQATAHLASLFRAVCYKGRVYHCSFCGGWHVGRHHGKRFR
jgi:hypothetical protein